MLRRAVLLAWLLSVCLSLGSTQCSAQGPMPLPVVGQEGLPLPAPLEDGRILIGDPATIAGEKGELLLQPSIQAVPTRSWKPPQRPTRIVGTASDGVTGPFGEVFPPPTGVSEAPFAGAPLWANAGLPIPTVTMEEANSPYASIVAPAVFDDVVRSERRADRYGSHLLSTLCGPHGAVRGPGLGVERVAYAPFAIDISQPMKHLRFRFDAAYAFRPPDRAEYLWARPSNQPGGRGPVAPEPIVSYQDFRFLFEMGGKRFSAATEIPIRVLDPRLNGNTAGMGDMNVTAKLVLCDGERWQVTHVFRTHILTGSASKGLGNGHVSLEPGLLARYKWDDWTFLHGEATIWVPVGGHPEHSGQIVRYGIGCSRVWYEADRSAVIPTLELVGMSVLDGLETIAPASTPIDVDGDVILHIHPGVRFCWDTCGDLGLLELGVSSAFPLGADGWYDELLRCEFRCCF